MRRYLFNKANYLLNNEKIEILTETDHSVRVKVGKYEIVFKYKNQTLIFCCSCKSAIYNKICSHSIAAQSYLSKKWKT